MRSCIPQKQPPARTALSLDSLIASPFTPVLEQPRATPSRFQLAVPAVTAQETTGTHVGDPPPSSRSKTHKGASDLRIRMNPRYPPGHRLFTSVRTAEGRRRPRRSPRHGHGGFALRHLQPAIHPRRQRHLDARLVSASARSLKPPGSTMSLVSIGILWICGCSPRMFATCDVPDRPVPATKIGEGEATATYSTRDLPMRQANCRTASLKTRRSALAAHAEEIKRGPEDFPGQAARTGDHPGQPRHGPGGTH